MRHFKSFILHPSIYKDAFEEMFCRISWKPYHLDFISNAETASMCFFRTLLREESGQELCSAEQASHDGEKILLLLARMYTLMDDNPNNHHLVALLAVSTGAWIADRQGEIRELELIVSGIVSFANQSVKQQDLEELYEISLCIMLATDHFLKADLDKQNTQRPWRFLCLNHCIIATRTGNGELTRLAYDRLIKYLPEEAEVFFTLAMRKVNAGQYSPHCQNVIRDYYRMHCSEQDPTKQISVTLN